jgi:PAS domain S-box-containing protein
MNRSESTIDYLSLFKTMPTAFIIFGSDDPTFTIVGVNEAHEKLTTVHAKNAIGKPLMEVFPDTSEAYLETGNSELLESIRRVIRTGKSDVVPRLHYDIKDKTGKLKTRYWSVSHHPLFDGDKVVAVYQETNDITDEALAHNELENAQYQLNQVLTAGNIATWMWDVRAKKIKGDSNMAKLFGLDPAKVAEGLPGDMYGNSVHPEDRERVSKEFEKIIKNPQHYETEYRTIDVNGDVHWLIVRGVIVNDNGRDNNYSPGIMIDITDRKRAEENLRFLTRATAQFSASLNYHTTLNTIASMVVPQIADWCSIELIEDGVLQQVAIAHKDPEKVKWAKELRKKQGPPDLNGDNGPAQVIRTGEPIFLPTISDEMIRAAAKNQDELKLLLELGFSSVIIVPMKLDNKVVGVLTFVATESRVHYHQSDVELAQTLANRAALAVYNATLYHEAKKELKERRQLQEALVKLNDELESRVQERTQQLLETNKGLEEEIEKRHAAEASLDKYAKELARSNQELQDFAYVASHDLQEPLRKIQAFGDLLDTELGPSIGSTTKEYLDRMRNAAARMSTLIQDLLSFSRVSMRVQPIEKVNLNSIAKEVLDDVETRIADTNGKVEIGQLPTVWADTTHMRQLFQNLIGNALKFHKPGVAPIVKVELTPVKPKDTMYTITFKDNGIGFDEKYVDRIFSVFQRLHGKDEYDGTGIGLAVCRKIAERYGGTITAASKKGSGSTFSFSIPISGKESHE